MAAKKAKTKASTKKANSHEVKEPTDNKWAEIVDRWDCKIEHDVPVPKTVRSMTSKWDALADQFCNLGDGDSFFIPAGKEFENGLEIPEDPGDARTKINSQCTKWRNYFSEEGRYFFCKKIPENIDGFRIDGVRVWRDDSKAEG